MWIVSRINRRLIKKIRLKKKLMLSGEDRVRCKEDRVTEKY